MAFRFAFGGTHEGVYCGTAPTGKAVEAWGVAVVRIEGERITDEWSAFDKLHRLQQLGIVPKLGWAVVGVSGVRQR